MLNDISHYFADDVGVSNTGDLQTVSGISRGQQRILRRLLTNPQVVDDSGMILPGDYTFHPDYGAGLMRFIGQTIDVPLVTAVIRAQLALEDSVAVDPAPVVTVTPLLDGMAVSIKYTDAPSGQATALSFNVNQ